MLFISEITSISVDKETDRQTDKRNKLYRLAAATVRPRPSPPPGAEAPTAVEQTAT